MRSLGGSSPSTATAASTTGPGRPSGGAQHGQSGARSGARLLAANDDRYSNNESGGGAGEDYDDDDVDDYGEYTDEDDEDDGHDFDADEGRTSRKAANVYDNNLLD